MSDFLEMIHGFDRILTEEKEGILQPCLAVCYINSKYQYEFLYKAYSIGITPFYSYGPLETCADEIAEYGFKFESYTQAYNFFYAKDKNGSSLGNTLSFILSRMIFKDA